jgi:RNA polymerase sigma-70 factor (ECF subfamily)
MTDAELLDAYRATHDRQILDGLFARHYPTVYHVLLRLVRNSTDASDLTQSTFLKALQSAESVRAENSLRNWLLTIAINEVRSFRRTMLRRNRQEALQELLRQGAAEPSRDADLLRREFEERLEQALRQFPEELKDPLVLHYYQSLSYAEVAQILGIAKSTVQSRMEQALQELRGRMKKRELLALLPELFAEQRRGRTLAWGVTIMNAKVLAYSAVLLCSLLVAGGVAWRASARPRSGRGAASAPVAEASSSAGSAKTAPAPVDPGGIGIFGRVIDRDTEAPVAGAVISAYDFERAALDQTRSDGNGAFRLPSAQHSAATFHLRIYRQGYAALSARSVSASSTALLFKLAGGGSITGRVQDADGVPVFPYRIAAVRRQYEKGSSPGKSALLYQKVLPEDWVPEEAECTIRSDGRFELRHLDPGSYVLAVSTPGAYPFYYPAERNASDEWRLEMKDGSTQDVVIVRPKVGHIRVHVTDRETHEPVQRASVSMLAWIDSYELSLGQAPSLTDENGCCAVPVSMSQHGGIDTTLLCVAKEGYAPQYHSFGGQTEDHVCEAMLARPARIRGHVRTREGAPVAQTAVYVRRVLDGFVGGPAFTDQDGAYSIEGLEGPHDYDIHVFDRRLKSSRSTRSVVLRVGETLEVDFGSDSGGGIRGRVARRGVPARDACVYVDGPGDARVSCIVNERGEFEMEGLAPGPYELFVSAFEAEPAIDITHKFTLGEGERKEAIFDLGEFKIRGLVCDAATLRPLNGEDCAYIVVRLVGAAGEPTVASSARDDGRFELVVPRPGIYEVTADGDKCSLCARPLRVDLTTASSVEDVRLLVTKDPCDGKLSIRVLDAATGEPIAGGWYRYRSGNKQGMGKFDGAAIEDAKLERGSHRYEVGGDDYVPVHLTLEITGTQPLAETTIKLVRSDAVLVTRVLPSSAAEQAGLKDGDLLVSYDGGASKNLDALRSLAGQVPPTQKATLEIRRGGERRVLVISGGTLGIEAENASLR